MGRALAGGADRLGFTLKLLRALLLALCTLAAAPAWAAQHYAVVMFASPLAYSDPAQAWAGFQAGQFQRVDPDLQALGWAQGPVWLVVRAAEPLPAHRSLALIVSPIPVTSLQAWWQAQGGAPWHSLGSDGVAVAPPSGTARSHGFGILAWPSGHAPDTHLVVRLQGLGANVLRGGLLDSAAMQTMVHIRGVGLGLIWCFMIVVVAFGMQAFMLSRQSVVLGWTALATAHAGWLGIFDGMIPLTLPGWTETELNAMCGLSVALLGMAYGALLLKTLLPPGFMASRRRALWAGVLGVLPAGLAGAWLGQGSLQGVVLWQLLQAGVLLGLLARRRRPCAVPLQNAGAQGMAALLLLVLGCTYAALLGWVAHHPLLHHGGQFVQWVAVLAIAYLLLNGTMTERRAARAERERLNALLRQDNQRLEQHVEQRTAELREALTDIQRLESHQRELLSLASHEFRTPAAIISSSLEVIDGLPNSIAPNASPYMDSVRAASRRLIYLANKLIDHDRWREMAVKLHLEPLELRAWTQALVDELPQNSRVLAVLGHEPAYLRADSVLLRIALQNLIDNALLHNGRHARVTVRLHCEAQQAHLMVDDGGHGVPNDRKHHVFDRYVSDRGTAREAHGLGLYIVHSIARQHGGTVQVSDAPGGGARFVISLPRYTPDAGPDI